MLQADIWQLPLPCLGPQAVSQTRWRRKSLREVPAHEVAKQTVLVAQELVGLLAGGKGHRRSSNGVKSREGTHTGAALS